MNWGLVFGRIRCVPGERSCGFRAVLGAALVLGIANIYVAVVEAKITFSDPGFSFLANRDFDISHTQAPSFETLRKYDFGDNTSPRHETKSHTNAVIPLKTFGKQKLYTGFRIKNFHLENTNPVLFKPDHQRRGIGFLALKRRLTAMIEVELEAGGFLGDRDLGAYTAARSYLDFQAVEVKAELRAERYRLKPNYRASVADDGWAWRTVGETLLELKGIGFLPVESNLKLNAYFEYDFGNSFKATTLPTPISRDRLYAEGHLRFNSPLLNDDSGIWLEAYANTRREIDLNARLDWFLGETENWRFDLQGLANYYVAPFDLGLAPSLRETGWLQSSLRADWVINQKHNFLFEPLVRWNFKRHQPLGEFETQLFVTHKWNLNQNWTLQNKVGAHFIDPDVWLATVEPRILYQNPDWSIEAYVREKRLLNGEVPAPINAIYAGLKPNLNSAQPHRAIGGELKFYKSNNSRHSFDVAITGEYKRFNDGRNDKQFGIKLDIAH